MQLIKEFYDFMIERESIRLRRLAGLDRSEWTEDHILQTYSFTNVKRHHDRTTMLLKKEFYDEHRDAEKITKLLNAAIYRYFGTIESARKLGWSPDLETALSNIHQHGFLLSFTPAYIVPSAGRSESKYVVVCDILKSIWSLADLIVKQDSWEEAIGVMKSCYGVGSFMAKEVYLDYLLATGLEPSDWTTWTPVGPGGKRGASRIMHGFNARISEREALDVIRAVYARREEYWPKTLRIQQYGDNIYYRCSGCVEGRSADCDCPEKWKTIDTVNLDLTDIQFQCCEFDKYRRVIDKDGKPKRLFKPTIDGVTSGR